MKLTINQLMTLQPALIAVSQIKLPAYPTASRFDRALRDMAKATAPLQELYHTKGVLHPNAGMYMPPTDTEARAALEVARAALDESPESSAAFEAAAVIANAATDRVVDFQVAWAEISNREVEIDFHPVHESELGSASIEPIHLSALRGFMILRDEAVTPVPLKLVPANEGGDAA